MSELRVDPLTLQRTAMDAEDLAERVRAVFGDEEVRVSAPSPAELGPNAERAADAVVDARRAFADRLERHSAAISDAARALENADEQGAAVFRSRLEQSIV